MRSVKVLLFLRELLRGTMHFHNSSTTHALLMVESQGV